MTRRPPASAVALIAAALLLALLSSATAAHYEDGSGTISWGQAVEIGYCLPLAPCWD